MMIIHNRQKSLKLYQINHIKEHGHTMTAEQMATQFGCHHATVRNVCKKLYVKMASKKFQPSDFVPPEVFIF